MLHPTTGEDILPMTWKEAEEHIPDIPPTAMPKTHLKGFNYIEYLIRRRMIGQLYPVSKRDQGKGPSIIGLLVPFQNALDECTGYYGWSGQDVSKAEFRSYLNENDIFIGNIDDFVRAKEAWNVEYKSRKQAIAIDQLEEKEDDMQTSVSPRLETMASVLEISPTRIMFDDKRRKWVLEGKSGYIYWDEIYGYVYSVTAISRRKLSAVKHKLDFMKFTSSLDNRDSTIQAEFRLEEMPTPEQARIIRKALRMAHVSEARKSALRERIEKVRPVSNNEALAA